MSRKICGIVVLLVVYSVDIQAHEQRDNNMSLSANPLLLAKGTISMSYEYGVGQRLSLVFPLEFFFSAFDFAEKIELLPKPRSAAGNTWAISLGIGTKFYLSNDAFKDGWYIYPTLLGGYRRYGTSDDLFLSLRVLGGYSWVFHNGFTINFGIGAQYSRLFSGPSSDVNLADLNQNRYPYAMGELDLGYSF